MCRAIPNYTTHPINKIENVFVKTGTTGQNEKLNAKRSKIEYAACAALAKRISFGLGFYAINRQMGENGVVAGKCMRHISHLKSDYDCVLLKYTERKINCFTG